MNVPKQDKVIRCVNVCQLLKNNSFCGYRAIMEIGKHLNLRRLEPWTESSINLHLNNINCNMLSTSPQHRFNGLPVSGAPRKQIFNSVQFLQHAK